MQGLHLTADLHNCRCDATCLVDAAQLSDWCVKAVDVAGLTALTSISQLYQADPDAGSATVTVLLACSHVCVHTWLAQKVVALDVYVCNIGGDQSTRARALMQALVERFSPEWTEQRSLDRGDES